MAKLEANTSVFDFVVNRTGSINNIIEFIQNEGIETVNQNLLGFETNPYTNGTFSTNLQNEGRIVATREIESAALTGSTVGAFTDGYDEGFEI